MTLQLTRVSDYEARFIPVTLDAPTLYHDAVQAIKILETAQGVVFKAEGTSPANQFLYHAQNYLRASADALLRLGGDSVTPVEGSIQWAMNRGTLFQVNGGQYKYGQMVTYADGPCEAANITLFKGDRYSTWLPPGTVLTVWNVYGGSTGGFIMKDPRRFVVQNGEALPETDCQYCDAPKDVDKECQYCRVAASKEVA